MHNISKIKTELCFQYVPVITDLEIYLWNSLKIHEEKTKENHKHVGSIYVIKINVL